MHRTAGTTGIWDGNTGRTLCRISRKRTSRAAIFQDAWAKANTLKTSVETRVAQDTWRVEDHKALPHASGEADIVDVDPASATRPGVTGIADAHGQPRDGRGVRPCSLYL